MPFDEREALFTDADPGYLNTRLESGIPPPSLSALPRIIRNPRGESSYASAAQRGRGPPRAPANPLRPTPTAPVVPSMDVVARLLYVVPNTRGPEFVEQLATAEWSRMMSERDDVRGRRSDPRLCDIGLLQSIQAGKEKLGRQPGGHADAVRAVDQYAAVSQCVLGGQSAVELGHVDFLLQPVREYVRAGRELQYVDVGSQDCGFARYIRWRVGQQPGGRARGWYFGAADAGAPLTDADLAADAGELLDPRELERFAARVRSASPGGVDVVVAEHVAAGRDVAEKEQYAYTMAQAAVALRVLRAGGTFVFRAREASTPLSAELLFLLHACFERTAIVRTFASRPTGPDRFVVCNRLAAEPRWVAGHLLAALGKMHAGQLKPAHLVSWTRVAGERQFIEPVMRSNTAIAQAQVQALGMAAQARPSAQFSRQQTELADACLRHWGLPPTKRQ
ncbi:hypothetical protein LPJ63_003770 [Coemansia sp. RSA 2711]|nr:hypothetical protein LPJ63_003770 [Coemansia sp. RSA 2711]